MSDPARRFEKCLAHIAAQMARKEGGVAPENVAPAITISRQTGAGAITFADALAQLLNSRTDRPDGQWAVFDKNLVAQVLDDHDLPARLERFMPEDKPRHLQEVVGDMLGLHPPDFERVRHTQETIYRLAKMGRCILVGRGANIITRDLPNLLHVRLIGSIENRIVRCMKYYGITRASARDLVAKRDRARRRYMLAYYDAEIDDPTNYHLMINVDLFGPDELMQLIAKAVELRISRSATLRQATSIAPD